MKLILNYFNTIKLDKIILWCYLIWYVAIVIFYFDPAPKIWINSLGISAVIGTGLILSVSSNKSNQQQDKRDYWQIFRLYFMPFCVSSFSTLIKDKGFIIFISPNLLENMLTIFICILFLVSIALIKLFSR